MNTDLPYFFSFYDFGRHLPDYPSSRLLLDLDPVISLVASDRLSSKRLRTSIACKGVAHLRPASTQTVCMQEHIVMPSLSGNGYQDIATA